MCKIRKVYEVFYDKPEARWHIDNVISIAKEHGFEVRDITDKSEGYCACALLSSYKLFVYPGQGMQCGQCGKWLSPERTKEISGDEYARR